MVLFPKVRKPECLFPESKVPNDIFPKTFSRMIFYIACTRNFNYSSFTQYCARSLVKIPAFRWVKICHNGHNSLLKINLNNFFLSITQNTFFISCNLYPRWFFHNKPRDLFRFAVSSGFIGHRLKGERVSQLII